MASGFVDGSKLARAGEWPPPCASQAGAAGDVHPKDQLVFQWVEKKIYPLFLHTDMYLELCLCKILSSPSEGMTRMGLDAERLVELLGTYEGIQRFKEFIAPRAGNACLQFWLDVGRLKQWEDQGVDTEQSKRDLKERCVTPFLPGPGRRAWLWGVPFCVVWRRCGGVARLLACLVAR